MARIADSLSRFLGRVEILARGADDERRAAARAMVEGRPLAARAHAQALLARVPRSPLGLALWADAAEACAFDSEVVQALQQLTEQLPWQHDLWLRLGEAATRCGDPIADEALQRAVGGDDQAIVRRALLLLADGAIAAGEVARAERWLDQVPYHPATPDAELSLRRAECLLTRGDVAAARAWEVHTRGMTEGGRVRLVRARLAAAADDASQGDHPVSLALAAFVLETPGADELLARLVAGCRDAVLVDRVRRTLHDVGRADEPLWRAAFALAEGRRDDARAALIQQLRTAGPQAVAALYDFALDQRDVPALVAAAEHAPEKLPPRAARLAQLVAAPPRAEQVETLHDLIADDALGGWASALLDDWLAAWLPPDGNAAWDVLLPLLSAAALRHQRFDLVGAVEQLAVERQRPLYVAILGEFNAGKSTMINALLATDVAPTGVRPTTASLHWVAWAPDPFARVVIAGAGDRVVPHEQLKAVIEEIAGAGQQLERAYIYAPIERLKRIEIIDTPGFNAPDPTHAAHAWYGIEQAHVALWLLDANAPLKDSERKVVDAIVQAGVPVQVIVNKADRLTPPQLTQVMDYITDALESIHVVSLMPPLALSARLALRGRLGDDEALAKSNWAAFEALLSEHIVDRREVLRERALRRKALAVAQVLAALETALRGGAEQAAAAALAEAERLRAQAQRLRSERADWAVRCVARLQPALARLDDDLRPLAQVDVEQRRGPSLQRYLQQRTVERLAEPLRQQLLQAVGVGAAAAGVGRAAVAGCVAGAVAATGQPLAGGALLAAVEVASDALAEALEVQAERVGGGEMGGAEGRPRRWLSGALARALESRWEGCGVLAGAVRGVRE